MSENLLAQRRSDSNDTVHLFTENSDEGDASLCDGDSHGLGAHVTFDAARDSFEVTDHEAASCSYLQRDRRIIGKFCGRCYQVLDMSNKYSTEHPNV